MTSNVTLMALYKPEIKKLDLTGFTLKVNFSLDFVNAVFQPVHCVTVLIL